MKHLNTARHRRLVEEVVKAREKAGLSQRDLAKKLKRSGSFVWKFESYERRLDFLELADIADACGVDAVELYRKVIRG